MPDTLPSDPEVVPSTISVTIVSVQGYTVEQVSGLLTQISSTFQSKPFDGRCPYLGLDAFSEDDAGRFFGRETLVSELVARQFLIS
jgi:hypothetical protein